MVRDSVHLPTHVECKSQNTVEDEFDSFSKFSICIIIIDIVYLFGHNNREVKIRRYDGPYLYQRQILPPFPLNKQRHVF